MTDGVKACSIDAVLCSRNSKADRRRLALENKVLMLSCLYRSDYQYMLSISREPVLVEREANAKGYL
jgi:hypothetical protein